MTEAPEEQTHWNAGGPKVYTEDDLTSAVAAGILPSAVAVAIKHHVIEKQSAPAADEEYFRLIGGFNDIFVVIACALLLVAVEQLGVMATPWAGGLALALASWGLAEYFVRKRHMALPAIVLLLTFEGGVASVFLSLVQDQTLGFVVACVAAALTAFLHWKRFKVPITVACGAAAAVFLCVTLFLLALPEQKAHVAFIFFLGGIAVFFWAMRWDTADVLRRTRRSDIAFWLHLLAAPLLVHPICVTLGIFDGDILLVQALCVVALYAVIACVSLCIDRRALMVSSLGYVVYAFGSLLKAQGQIDRGFIFAALFIGAALLLLSAGWQRARAFTVRRLPVGLQKRLPPVIEGQKMKPSRQAPHS